MLAAAAAGSCHMQHAATPAQRGRQDSRPGSAAFARLPLTSGVMKSDTKALTSLHTGKATQGRAAVRGAELAGQLTCGVQRPPRCLCCADCPAGSGNQVRSMPSAAACAGFVRVRTAAHGRGDGPGASTPGGCLTHAVKAEPTTMPTAMSTTLPRSCMGVQHAQREWIKRSGFMRAAVREPQGLVDDRTARARPQRPDAPLAAALPQPGSPDAPGSRGILRGIENEAVEAREVRIAAIWQRVLR